MKVRITHSNQLFSQSITMFQKVIQLLKNIVPVSLFLLPGVANKLYPFTVDGKGQLRCIETGEMTRKRSSFRDVLL